MCAWVVGACNIGRGPTVLTSIREHDQKHVAGEPSEARFIVETNWAKRVAVWGDYDLRHRGVVQARFSRDGRTLVSVGRSGDVRIWDVSARALVRSLPGDDRSAPEVTAMALSPDSSMALIGDRAGSLMVRELRTGRTRRKIVAHEAPIRFLAWAADGASVISYGYEHRSAIPAALPSGDTPEVMRGGEIRRWDLATGAKLAEVRAGGLAALAASPEERRLVGGGGGWLRAWDGGTLKEVWRKDLGSRCRAVGREFDACTSAVAASPQGRMLVLSAGQVLVVDPATGGEIDRFGEMSRPNAGTTGRDSLAVSPDDGEVLAIVNGADLEFWSCSGTSRARASGYSLGDASSPEGAAYAADGSVFVTWSRDRLLLWDGLHHTPLPRAHGHDEPVIAMDVSADGAHVVSASLAGTVIVWDARLGSERAHWHADAMAVSFSPDGRKVLVAEGNARLGARGAVTSVRALDGHVVWSVDGRVAHAPSRWSPDGNRVLTISAADGLEVLDGNTGSSIWQEGKRRFETRDLLWLPDGKSFLADDEKGHLSQWDGATGTFIAKLADRGFLALALTEDGRRLAAAGDGVHMLDPTTGTLVQLERDSNGPMAFTHDGTKLVIADYAGTVTSWPVDGSGTSSPIDLSSTQDRVTALALSPDGARLYCGTDRGLILVFDLARP
jgi:WD40 repeat protein